MWSQLAIGWQWSAPDTAGTAVATFVMSAAILVLAVLALLAALPVAWTVAARSPAARRARPGSARPRCSWPGWRSWSSAAGTSATAGRAPAGIRGRGPAWCPAGWPRSPGRPRCRSPRSGRTPPRWPPSPRPNSPGWPSARSRWPALVAGAATAVRRAELSPAVLRFESWLAAAACVTWPSSSARAAPGSPAGAAAGEPVPPRRDRRRRARGHGPGPRAVGAAKPPGQSRRAPGMTPNGPGAPLDPPPRADVGLAPAAVLACRRGRPAPSWSPAAYCPAGPCSRSSTAPARCPPRRSPFAPPGPVRRRHVLLRGPPPDGRLHDRLPARPPPRGRAAAGGHAARLRREPRRRAGRDVARAGRGAEARRPAAGPDGDGHRRTAATATGTRTPATTRWRW